MKRLLFLLVFLSSLASAQNIPSYNLVWKVSELKYFSGNNAFTVIALVNDYKDGLTGGVYTFCDTCTHPMDSNIYIPSYYNGFPEYPYMWVKTSEVPSIGNMTGQNNKVIRANGVVPTWSNVGSLFNSMVLQYAAGNMTATLSPISGSDIVSNSVAVTASAPTLTVNNTPSRSMSTTGSNNTFTPSTTKWTFCSYTINISVNLILSALTCNGQVDLEYSTDAGTTWKSAGASASINYTVGIVLAMNQNQQIWGLIPPNALVRINRSQNTNVTITAPTNKQYEATFN